ncbi:MAG: MurR/RpiR family transcriptional regulator [Pseudomonadota bacterium]
MENSVSAENSQPNSIIDRLQASYGAMSPRVRQAARYLMDNPNEIGVSSMRQIAYAANVPPNTLVRVAKAIGLDGYEELRHPFREALKRGGDSIPDRARSLQKASRSGRHNDLFQQLSESSVANVETLFAQMSITDLREAARLIIKARNACVLGMGGCYSAMQGFYYVGRMALPNLSFTPQPASTPLDDVARLGPKDVLFAATYYPYRREAVETALTAKARGVKLIAMTDSRSSPIAADADLLLLVPTTTPQFFPSTLAMVALLESLLAFIVSETGNDAVANIESFDEERRTSGIYWPDDRV